MSYEIVKSIMIKDNKVFITSNCNNVYPRIPKKWECKSISEILQKDGLEAAQRCILRNFADGSFSGNSSVYGKVYSVSDTSDLDTLYNNLVFYKNNKNKYLIQRGSEYFMRTTSRRAFLTDDVNFAKSYNTLDAVLLVKRFPTCSLVDVIQA